MRLLFLGGLILLMTACAPQPNPVVQKLQLANLQIATVISIDAAVQSALQRKDIVITPDTKDPDIVISTSTKYVEPFQGCARYNVAHRFKNTGFIGSENNYDSIVKICEIEGNKLSAELMNPEVPDVTGRIYIVDENGKLLEEKKKI